jgi:Mn-dependent DtxR family transcriptional regulator
MIIRESAEMYLETVLVLSKKGAVKAIDIAKAMNFSRPSVSVTIHNLEKDGFLKIDEDGSIILQEKGLEIAKRIYERHTFLTQLLECIGVPKKIAEEDACKIEHDISEETFSSIKKAVKKSALAEKMKEAAEKAKAGTAKTTAKTNAKVAATKTTASKTTKAKTTKTSKK